MAPASETQLQMAEFCSNGRDFTGTDTVVQMATCVVWVWLYISAWPVGHLRAERELCAGLAWGWVRRSTQAAAAL